MTFVVSISNDIVFLQFIIENGSFQEKKLSEDKAYKRNLLQSNKT